MLSPAGWQPALYLDMDKKNKAGPELCLIFCLVCNCYQAFERRIFDSGWPWTPSYRNAHALLYEWLMAFCFPYLFYVYNYTPFCFICQAFCTRYGISLKMAHIDIDIIPVICGIKTLFFTGFFLKNVGHLFIKLTGK